MAGLDRATERGNGLVTTEARLRIASLTPSTAYFPMASACRPVTGEAPPAERACHSRVRRSTRV